MGTVKEESVQNDQNDQSVQNFQNDQNVQSVLNEGDLDKDCLIISFSY